MEALGAKYVFDSLPSGRLESKESTDQLLGVVRSLQIFVSLVEQAVCQKSRAIQE